MQIEISEFESESPRDQGEVETTDLVVTGAEEEGPLLRTDMVEFLAAFLIGATIGVGTLLLLRPAPETGRARVKKSLRPYQRKIRKDLAEARESFSAGREALNRTFETIGAASRVLARDLKEEIGATIGKARREVVSGVERGVTERLDSIRHVARQGRGH